MKGKFTATMAVVALLTLSACGQRTQEHCGLVDGKNVCGNSQLVQTSDGRYGMWGPDGYWCWYMLGTMNNGGIANQHYYYGTGPIGVPNGGQWVRSPTAPNDDVFAGATTMPLTTIGNNGSSFTSGVATEEEPVSNGNSFTSGGTADASDGGGSSYTNGGTSSNESEGGSSLSSGGSGSTDTDSGGSYSSGGDTSSGSSTDSGGSYSSGGDSSGPDSGGSYSSGSDSSSSSSDGGGGSPDKAS